MTRTVEELAGAVVAADGAAYERALERHAGLAKPPGSLGRLEDLGARLAAIAGRCPPPIPSSPAVVVAAADHGVHAQGVSDWPQEVTAAMVETVAAGGAAVNAIARTVGARVEVVDVGTLRLGPVPGGVHDERVRSGTRDLAVEPAMTIEECRAAIGAGARVAAELIDGGADLLVTGEVGIGNTTASAALIAAFTGAEPAEVTGKGANLDHERTPHKVEIVRTALARHAADTSVEARGSLGTLASLGGLEHAALVGVMLAGAAARIPVIVDGVITGAAALAAVALCPDVAGYLIAGHTSAEPGGRSLPDRLGEPALLDLRLRLGEGTGALLAVPLVQAAARVLTDMVTLADVTKTA
ncbi:nicotinate-nucleotide--dimethylbenzimidazole phosphoribosyltransferase [Jiangella anatolica]|uniref:Nicotinate-nucleotide--dimethylbenzimidazole phosphoribosyltransferase n=1 Tax=Jiangella anatolica TaxID=2670374 RepID=A0A2W2C5E5_9ACTN|nr:nicotinate-nucleotide--dimethylbenzimidazole phosphoribosyltransferase [Jiangella anatolica]PZF80946.1 nicotinate-nucleotide--dimethylbenzimidazole phosphoribosyltransferase [Jiangella anatolica]